MTTRIRRYRARPRRVGSVPVIAWLVATVGAASIAAQPESTPTDAQLELRQAVQDRFEVVVLFEGLGLSPREGAVDARMIEVGDGSIAVDGRPVSGQELRDVIGDDADVVFRLTYLDATTRAALFQTTDAPPAAVAPQLPDAPAVVSETQPASEDADETVEREPERPARRTTMSDIVRVFGSVTVDTDERVRGDVVVIAGSLSIDGEVTGDVVVVGGSARFGPNAVLRRDVTVVGGSISRSPTAEFRRGVNHVGIGELDFFRDRPGWFAGAPFSWRFSPRLFRVWDLAGTVIRLIFLALIASVIVFVGGGAVERIARRSRAEPVKAGLVGFLAQILLLPLVVAGTFLLLISIIGIPLLVLLPFVAIALLLVMLVGFTGVVHGVGAWFGGRLGRTTPAPYLSVWVGIALLLIPTMASEAMSAAGSVFGFFAVMLALTGVFIEYAAWTTGFGAVLLNRFGSALSPPAPGMAGRPPHIPDPPPAVSDAAPEPPPDVPADRSLDRS